MAKDIILKRSKKWYGYTPDLPDQRDHRFGATRRMVAKLPNKVDLRAHCPPIMDQGQLGSCTAHGITCAIRYDRLKNGLPDLELSRLQLYYDERKIEGTIASDAGAEIRDGIKTTAKAGVGREIYWPYDIKKFAAKPPAKVYGDARADRALEYSRVDVDATQIKAALAGGNVVVIGIAVFESFESAAVAKTGMVPMPAKSEQSVGGHCMCVVGYGIVKGHFTVQNSWAADWGDKGFCHLPEKYLGTSGLGSDYWIVKSVGK